MNVLITGATGFLGKYIIDRMLSKGSNMILATALSDEGLERFGNKISFIPNCEILDFNFSSVDLVVNCAFPRASDGIGYANGIGFLNELFHHIQQRLYLFQHLNNLPILFDSVGKLNNLDAICVSSRPRRVEGSYMPCFLAGLDFAKSLSSILSVDIYEVSHQEGHLQSYFLSKKINKNQSFLAVHLSGGTTEILLCKSDNNGFETTIVGGTKDISAGQFIDRVGVELGYRFPCGKQMDTDYKDLNSDNILRVSKDKTWFSFSGNDTKLKRLIENNTINDSQAIYFTFHNIAETLCEALSICSNETGISKIVFTGGVSSSINIKNLIIEKLFDLEVVFADSIYASDCAVGTAYLGERIFNDRKISYGK